MVTLGSGGPPEAVPSVPRLSLSYDDVAEGDAIGQGGNADVYRVAVERDGETVSLAVKQPRLQGTLRKETVSRFVEEAEVWNELDGHDHVVDLVDWDDQPLPWLAMEYMDGGTLEARLSDGRLPLAQAVWVALCVCKAVRYAHRHGVAHHDVKPANVLFREVADGWDVPKVSDWGLARMMLDETGSVEGLSPQYAAPEQFDADRYGSPDDITDIYQVGVLAYELVAGEPPFSGSAASVMQSILTEEPDPPSEVADVPESVDEAIMPALRTEKAERYDSLIYLRDALSDLFGTLRSDDGVATGAGGSGPTAGTTAGSDARRDDGESDSRPEAGGPDAPPDPAGTSDESATARAGTTRTDRESGGGGPTTDATPTGGQEGGPSAGSGGSSRRSVLKTGAGLVGFATLAGVGYAVVGDEGASGTGGGGGPTTDDADDSGGGTGDDAETETTLADVDTVRLGTLLPSDDRLSGQPMRNAARLAAGLVDAETSVSVDVRSVDAGVEPGPAVDAAEQLVSDGCDVVVGPAQAEAVAAVGQEVFGPENVVGVAPVAPAPDAATGSDYTYALAPSATLRGEVLGTLAVEEATASGQTDVEEPTPGGQTGPQVSALFSSSIPAYGEGVRRGIRLLGGELVETAQFDVQEQDPSVFGELLAQALDPQPAALVANIFPPQAQPFFEAYREFAVEYEVPLLVPGYALDSPAAETIDWDLEGVHVATVPSRTDAANEFFEERYRQEFDDDPMRYASFGFDAAAVGILAAISARATGDSVRSRMATVTDDGADPVGPEALPSAVSALLEGERRQYRGVTGPVLFDDDGTRRATRYELSEFVDGERQSLDTALYERG